MLRIRPRRPSVECPVDVSPESDVHRRATPLQDHTTRFHVLQQTMLYISGIVFGSTVLIRGPERKMFTVTTETLSLAFVTPGQYTVTVRAPRETRALRPRVTIL